MSSMLGFLVPSTYSTNKEVTLLDRKLGILYVICSLLVFGYVIGVRVVLEQDYTESEFAYGISGVQLNGTSYVLEKGAVVPKDAASLLMTGAEGDALFLPTRTIVQRGQKLSNCTAPDEPCSDDSDCQRAPPIAKGQCVVDEQQCLRYQWCNKDAKGQTSYPFDDAATGADAAQVLQGLDRLSLVITASITYRNLGGVSFSNDDQGRNKWTIAQVLQRAGLTEEQAQTKGARVALAGERLGRRHRREHECDHAAALHHLGPPAYCLGARGHDHAKHLLRAAPLSRVQDRAVSRLFLRARKGRAAREAVPESTSQGHGLRVT